MNRHGLRRAWVKYAALAALVAAGGASGLYLSTRLPADDLTPIPIESTSNDLSLYSDSSTVLHRFPLTALDAKDTIEAPDLAVASNGRVFITWASKTGDTERTVFLTRTTDDGRAFDPPKIVSKGSIYKTTPKGNSKTGGYERRATPHVAVDGDTLHLAWSEGLSNGSGMRMIHTTSIDAGTTFGPLQQVHRGDGAKPTFTAMTIGSHGALVCSWLDDRTGTQQPFVAIHQPGTKEFEVERLVHSGQDDKGVCQCCPTAVAFGQDGTLYVAFRNIQDGYRDIAISRLKPGARQFDGPFSVIPNTWKFDGCPHDGPSLAVIGDTLHVLWMDARSGPQRCYHGWAKVADMKFTARELHPGTPGTQGNAKLCADSLGNVHAVWEESTGIEPTPAESPGGHQHGQPKVGVGGGRAVVYARILRGEAEFSGFQAIAPKSGTFQTRPGITVTPTGDVFIAWNELDVGGKAVVVTRLTDRAHRTEGVRP